MKIIRLLLAGALVAVSLVAFAPAAGAANGCEPYLYTDFVGVRCTVDTNGVGAAFTPTVIVDGTSLGPAVGGGVCTGTDTNNPYCVHYLVMQGPGSFSYYDVCYGYPMSGPYTCVL